MNDLNLFNANVITMDHSLPRARSVVARNGLIADVLQGQEFRQPRNEKNIPCLDCRGKTVVPGFIDAHCHLASYAERFVVLDLSSGVSSISDLQERIHDFCTHRPAGTWLRGKGYNEFSLAEHRHPTRWDLDLAAPSHPVKLTHRSGHAHALNSAALKLAGIAIETGDPPGGLIDRDIATGEPTGILYGMGAYLAEKIPPIDDTEIERGLVRANERLLSYGITSLHDVSSYNDLRQWKRFERWISGKLLEPRITMTVGINGFSQLRGKTFQSGIDMNHLRAGGIKIVLDESTGHIYPSPEILKQHVMAANDAGLQIIMHAVEERAINAACDAIEDILLLQPCTDHRHRIDHSSLCPPALRQRIRNLGIVVSTQPSFIYYNGDRYLKTVPESQQQYLYPIASMIKEGIIVCASSDFPITDPNPIVGIYAAATRLSQTGNLLIREERVSPLEALRLYTISAAEAGFEEKVKGSITRGKLADLVVLSDSPLINDQERIKDIHVEMTIIGGRVVWQRGN